MITVTKDAIIAGLRKLGVKTGDSIFIHASIRSIGYIQGGPKSVVDAILDVIGPEGTLAAPAFNFCHEIQDNPIIDPMNDKSEMGSITQAVQKIPGACRSIAYRHSVSAYGPHAEQICNTPDDVSPFSMEGSFGQLLDIDADILLIGVAYTHCTCGHFAEFLNDVPYRQVLIKPMRVLQKDGSLKQVAGVDYQPKPSADGSYYHKPADFNKAGDMLEKLGRVKILPIGNAYFRLFKLKDFMELVGENFKNGRNILYFEDGQTQGTPLNDGCLVEDFFMDEANRQGHSVRSVVKRDDIYKSGASHANADNA